MDDGDECKVVARRGDSGQKMRLNVKDTERAAKYHFTLLLLFNRIHCVECRTVFIYTHLNSNANKIMEMISVILFGVAAVVVLLPEAVRGRRTTENPLKMKWVNASIGHRRKRVLCVEVERRRRRKWWWWLSTVWLLYFSSSLSSLYAANARLWYKQFGLRGRLPHLFFFCS